MNRIVPGGLHARVARAYIAKLETIRTCEDVGVHIDKLETIARARTRAPTSERIAITDFGTAGESSIQNVINFRAIRKFARAAVCEFDDPLEVW